MVTLTVIKIDGKTRANWSTPFDSRFVRNLRPLDRTNISTDAVFEYEVAPNQYQTFQVSENCDTVAASFTADDQEQGAELQANKDASGGYAGLTLLKINFKNVLNTFTSFFTNSNTAARTYTFQDRNGTIADDTDLALKEATANKATDFSVINDTKFPTTDAVEDSFQPIWFVAATGTDTYAATLTGVVPVAYYTGMSIKATFQNANTGAATINVNALGAKTIKKGTGGATDLAGADLVTTKIYTLIYDGTNFQIDL